LRSRIVTTKHSTPDDGSEDLRTPLSASEAGLSPGEASHYHGCLHHARLHLQAAATLKESNGEDAGPLREALALVEGEQ
jgi:hypothetical protein